MAFTVEDGTIVDEANSYVSVEYADAFFAERGITAWDGEDTAKQYALVKATDYVDTFNNEFKDTSKGGPLYFPSNNESGLGEMPSQLLKAVCEYALIALSTPLTPNPVIDNSGMQLESFEKTVGPLTTKKKFLSSFVSRSVRYPSGDKYLRQLLRTGGTVIRS